MQAKKPFVNSRIYRGDCMDQMQIRLDEARRALTEKPLFATSVERVMLWHEFKGRDKDQPHPLRFARLVEAILQRVSTPVAAHDLIAGRGVDRELNDGEEAVYQELIHSPDFPQWRTILHSGHATYDWAFTVQQGLPGLRAMAKQNYDTCDDAERRAFAQAQLIIYDAIEAYALRYADAAETHGMAALASQLRACVGLLDSFCAALQFVYLVAFINANYLTENCTLTLGRLDQILYPLYRHDIASGALTREQARAYITDYYCKFNLIMGRGEHQVGDETNTTGTGRILCFDSPLYLLLCGTDIDGRSAVNELTELFCECIEPQFKNPVCVIQYFPGMNEQHPQLWNTLVARAMASSSMMFYNDDNVLRRFQQLGVPREDLQHYGHFGCNWPTPGPQSAWMQIGPGAWSFDAFESPEEEATARDRDRNANLWRSYPELFVTVLRELADDESATIDDCYRLFFARMERYIDRKLEIMSTDLDVRRRRPAHVMTYGDCFYQESVRTGTCFAANAKYHFDIMSFQMFGTVADCFIAVDQLVFREKKLTLRRLLEAVDAGFVGYPDVLALCRGAEKYGMDTPLSNLHVHRLSQTCSDLHLEKSRPYFEKQKLFLVSCIQCDTWHLKEGLHSPATPDGRLANTVYSQNSNPSRGACINGMTAMFNSLLQHPAGGWLSGALNVDVDPKQFSGESGRKLFGAMLAVYFNRGGLHAQVSGVNPDDLRDAQVHPENHRDLRVRVTGYSGVFVDICKSLQDDIIARMDS